MLCREADASKEQLESMLANHETGKYNHSNQIDPFIENFID